VKFVYSLWVTTSLAPVPLYLSATYMSVQNTFMFLLALIVGYINLCIIALLLNVLLAPSTYMLKHCREYFTKNKVRGARPSTLFL